MSATTQWTDLENYKRALQEYERRNAEYQKALEAFRAATAETGKEDAEVKARLEKEYADISGLFERVTALRKNLAETLDSSLAAH